MGHISAFMEKHFLHFNSRETLAAAQGWQALLQDGGRMFLAMAGAMSTAEIGKSLARMIDQGKVHAISCTAANLEEDIFNLVAHDHYRKVPKWRELTAEQEAELYQQGFNRVTDTCIPEGEAFRRIQEALYPVCQKAEHEGRRAFFYEYFYDMIDSGALETYYQIDPADSWVVAACKKRIPIWTPGFEDSTTGNVLVAWHMAGELKSFDIFKGGLEQMKFLADWYQKTTADAPVGFFQIGGGIAGDFPICVVPMIKQDLKIDCRYWAYFAQISDSTTSYGSYSGAVPNEKITWGKLAADTPRYMINSDASIVAPLIFAYVMGE